MSMRLFVSGIVFFGIAACASKGGEDPAALCKKKWGLDNIPHAPDSDTIKKCVASVEAGKTAHPEEFKCYANCVNGASSWDVAKKCDNVCLFED